VKFFVFAPQQRARAARVIVPQDFNGSPERP
jgi:hypothetical protein